MIDAPTRLATAAASQGELRQRLRQETAAEHARLETSLDLLSRIPDRQRVQRMLERFLGFHMIWERSIRQQTALRAFHEPRTRLPHLRRDLAALGRTNAEQADLPLCAQAALLADSRSAAIGSLYVLEGSTLGGQVIGRALAKAGWVPAGGLTYFDPYPGRTGEMWRSFLHWAEATVGEGGADEAVAGARTTFAVLQAWMTA